MEKPLVSIGISVWNGELFLAETLDSILAQDYEKIEIIILDNLSSDLTPDICKKYAQKDSRIRYILDTEKRNVMEGQKRVFNSARGEYFMIACDDDVYAPSYINELINLMHLDTSIGLAYSAYEYISPDGLCSPANFKAEYFLNRNNSKIKNFMQYLRQKNPIPIVFGLVRTASQRDALQYYLRVDQLGWDHDNLYLLRLLSKTRVDSTDEILFRYRQRDRDSLYQSRGQLGQKLSKFEKYRNDVSHQIKFTAMVHKIINEAPFSYMEKKLLWIYAVFIMFLNFKRQTRELLPIPRKLIPRITRRMRSWGK